MKQISMIVVLTCILFSLPCSVLAGNIPTDGLNSSLDTTSSPSSGEIPSVPGEIPSGGVAQDASDAGLAILQSLMAVLAV